jgi:hypothetical protein
MSNESYGESDVTPTESETTGTVGNFPHGSRETPETSVFFFHGSGSVGEGARPQFRHARCRGVTQFHSTGETGEQGRRGAACGVGGGKGTDQGEHRQSLLARTQRRNSDGTPFVARSRGLLGVRVAAQQRVVCTSTSTVRTVCGSSARTDLCGGRSAMTVPTAIENRPEAKGVRRE